ncbi:acyl-CoA N-acyltransferase [Nitzschia inconspicua]|uniref:Acyl-CoA N-acyltransferase n=1 Tax=Nitzschia inconspicua TaxID=303405 RepID=A0A9K3M5A6_9STRA|nr:acyl-CoA N-acyltransferase [Nitzschia inconspicua]
MTKRRFKSFSNSQQQNLNFQSTRLFSVSAYSGVPSDGKTGTETLALPLRAKLGKADGSHRLVEVDTFQSEEEIETGRRLMNEVIVEGKAWPFEPIFETNRDFQGYFLSHAAFVVRSLEKEESGAILGCFYIKPNFPGRCSHVANGGFIVDPQFRGNRVGTLMGACFKRWAKDLGYKAAYFNLVFASNQVSVKLWEKLGFDRVAVIPKCARLEGMPVDPETCEPELDTAYGYHIDLDALPEDYDPMEEATFFRP